MTSLEEKIGAFIKTGEGDFNDLACELFHHQCHANPAYGHFAASVQPHTSSISRWQDIPALPISAFKKAAISTFPIAEARVVFHSSGTTSTERSSHYFKTTRLYELSVLHGWPTHPSGKVRILAACPSPRSVPDSSLIHMFWVLIRHYGDPISDFAPEPENLAELLAGAEADGCPVWLLGTALSLHALLNYCDSKKIRFAFESNLLAMETGGFKGQAQSIPQEHFYQRLCKTLGISMFSILSEYGMCELSSQFYTRSGAEDRSFSAPPWARWRVIHPLTGLPLADGERGALEIIDLANVHSVIAIRTEDIARESGGGFRLEGRIPQAPVKGCSLMA
jgi:hypothetical protein